VAWIDYSSDDAVDNIERIHSVSPGIRQRHVDLYLDLMRRPGPLSRTQREMIAVVVSAENECHY
jgi:alkylhydroperoxidase family enzyme